MSQSCPLPPSLHSLPAVQTLGAHTRHVLAVASSNLQAVEGNLGWQISPSKAEKINGLNLGENETPVCPFCFGHCIDISSFPCKELKSEACDMLTS